MRRTRRMYAAAAWLLALGMSILASAGSTATAAAQPSARFTTERVFAAANDDWEPAVATDAFGHVYIITTRYGAEPACRRCPEHFLVYRVSPDGGQTWGAERYLCQCPGVGFQNDPEIVTDSQGRVFVAYMNDYRVSFQRSDDFGEHWFHYRTVDGNLVYTDKPTIAVSASGLDVYIVYNAAYRPPLNGKPYAVSSHDGGRSWSEPVLAADNHGLYWFSGGSTVTPDGTVVVAQDAYHQNNVGNIALGVLRSRDAGASWQAIRIGSSHQQRPCPPTYGCEGAYLGPQATVASDAKGRVYVLYNANHADEGPARLFLRVSVDGGATWGVPVDVAGGPPSVDHEFPMIAATGQGDVRIAWMDDRTGAWNTVYRRSTDGGDTWGSEVRLSNRPDGAPYKRPEGFQFPYGDYGQIAIDSNGLTEAVWGEGPNYIGPGGTWYARGL